MLFFKKLFHKEEKNDIEKYMDERKKENEEPSMSIIKDPTAGVPDDVICKKQIENGIYICANYWNDGTLIVYGPHEDEEYISRNIKLTYNLIYHRLETIDALVEKMKASLKNKDVWQILSDFDELNIYYIMELSNNMEYAIYRDMGMSEKFMDTYLELFKTPNIEIDDFYLFSKCVEANIYEGKVEYAVKLMEEFLKLFHQDKEKWKEFAEQWFYVYSCMDGEETYIKHHTEFKNRLREDHFGEFIDVLEEAEDWHEEMDFKEKQKREQIDTIVETFKKNPALAMEQWIKLVQEKEACKEIEEWQSDLFSYFATALYCEFGSCRGMVLLAREFMKHEEWFHYLVYAREDAYSIGDDLVKLRINKKYETQIDKIVKILHDEWNEEEWEEFKEGYTLLDMGGCTIEKDSLEQLVAEEIYMERHNKHFQELYG